MTATAVLIAGPVALPLLAAGVSLLLSRLPTAQRVLGVIVLAAVVVDAAWLVARVDQRGVEPLHVGGWHPPVGITLVADRFSALALLVGAVVCLVVLIYAIGESTAEWRVEHVPSVFHPTYLVLMAGIGLAFLTGDLFTLFVGLEVMLMASYVLITLGSTAERVRTGMTYIISSLTASILLLTSIGLIYAVAGTVNLAQLSGAMPEVSAGTRQFLALMLLAALGIKAAMVPLHWWLPDSYPTAPAPVTAIFAALLTKVAIYAIIRTQTLLFPRPEPWTLLLVLAALTMLVGVLGSLVQDDINRVLSFVLVSHIGFMLFGLAIFTVAGLTGAVIYLVHHITVQTALFLLSGLMEWRQDTVSLARMGGLAATAPSLALMLLIPAFSVGGVPPLAGFIGKLALLQAAVERPDPLVIVVAVTALLVSLLTLAAMTRVWMLTCWRTPPQPDPGSQPEPGTQPGPGTGPEPAGDVEAQPARPATELVPVGSQPARLMQAAAAVAVLIGLAVAAAAGPLSEFSQRAAADLVDRTAYRQAVLGDDAVTSGGDGP